MFEAVIAEPNGLLTYQERPIMDLEAHDVLINVKATGVNPVDSKQRMGTTTSKILGYDAVGIVADVGSAVQAFQVGDRVFYSGDVTRAGSFATKQVVREELITLAPQNLTDVEAATIPLTFLTAYELLVDKFGLTFTAGGAAGKTLLIINGAGAVGRVMTQLAKGMGMQVIATASNPESQAIVRENGADYVVNHREDYAEQLKNAGWHDIPYIAILHEPNRHFAQAADLIAPFGYIGLIVAPDGPMDIGLVKNKAVSIAWEFMFAKAGDDMKMAEQGYALELAARLATEQLITPFVGRVFDGLTVGNIESALKLTDAGRTYGKQVVTIND